MKHANTLVLQSSGLCMAFGDFKVLEDIDLRVTRGEIVGVLGPNGAGKTTLMNLLTGAYAPTAGNVHLLGRDVTRMATAARCHNGLGRTHQVPRPFGGMTVFENVLVAVRHGRANAIPEPIAAAWDVLRDTGLTVHANRHASTLGLLDRKRLELSRALATDPQVLLLDEIGGGLNESEGDKLVRLIRKIHAGGVTIIWIEHIMRMLTDSCSRLICMAGGQIIADGTPSDVINAPAVQSAYFGASA